MHATPPWLEIEGGSAMYRDGILRRFQEAGPDPATRSIEALAQRLGASVRIVFVETDDAQAPTRRLAPARPDEYVIAIARTLSVASFRQLLDHGASAVTHEENSLDYLCDVVRAALSHDLLVPRVVWAAGHRGGGPKVSEDLSSASRELLVYLAGGLSTKQIANKLGYSERTIRRRVSNLCLLLGAQSTSHAVRIAVSSGLID